MWNRHLTLGFIWSLVLHVLVLWVGEWIRPAEEGQRFETRLRTVLHWEVERFRASSVPAVGRDLLERLRGETGYDGFEPEMGVSMDEEVEPLTPEALEGAPEVGQRPEWKAAPDTLDAGWSEKLGMDELPPGDLVELDALRRRGNVALIDPVTGKLKRAYVHLPVYEQVGAELIKSLELLRRGFFLPKWVPIQETVYVYPREEVLEYAEMVEYGVIDLRYIGVRSTQAVVRYLLEGGFGIVSGGDLGVLERALADSVGARSRRVSIELGHPLFHSFYDITRYRAGNGVCSCPVAPVVGLEVDGRLVAAMGTCFNRRAPCPANRLYVNILAYALVQPGRIGSRYLAAKGDSLLLRNGAADSDYMPPATRGTSGAP